MFDALASVMPAAHPRVGGENLHAPSLGFSSSGSSPRGRGKPGDIVDDQTSPGLIPAWAGKTRREPDLREASAAHPRVGGENVGFRGQHGRWSGSSPRGRGKRHPLRHRVCHGGLIPAWAGKTYGRSRRRRRARAHPRVGGENEDRNLRDPVTPGSSPRGRGKPRFGPFGLRAGGLIPAWAGKTRGHAAYPHLVAAHPRVGGENERDNEDRARAHGSSPRGRGKLAAHVVLSVDLRLIPAWAGKTRRAVSA